MMKGNFVTFTDAALSISEQPYLSVKVKAHPTWQYSSTTLLLLPMPSMNEKRCFNANEAKNMLSSIPSEKQEILNIIKFIACPMNKKWAIQLMEWKIDL